MRPTFPTLLTTAILCLATDVMFPKAAVAAPRHAVAFAGTLTNAWRTNPVWRDGQAEYCAYDSTRRIYGDQRRYRTKIYTNTERADPETKTKSATSAGRDVFKHHVVEVVPTENYDYKFSTMCYVGASDMKSLKIDMGSQDDCGASFKQFVNHAGTLTWTSFVYFPGAGHSQGTYTSPPQFVYQDALSLVLRGYPFDAPMPPVTVNLLPDQTSPRTTFPRWRLATIAYVGPETLTVPAGTIAAHHLRVAAEIAGKTIQHDYWFAASGAAPRLHVMVQYTGPMGAGHVLREQRRWSYWQR